MEFLSKKKFQVLLFIYCFALILNGDSRRSFSSHFTLWYYFRKGKNAVQARKKLHDVFGEKSLTERQCQNCFACFRPRDK